MFELRIDPEAPLSIMMEAAKSQLSPGQSITAAGISFFANGEKLDPTESADDVRLHSKFSMAIDFSLDVPCPWHDCGCHDSLKFKHFNFVCILTQAHQPILGNHQYPS